MTTCPACSSIIPVYTYFVSEEIRDIELGILSRSSSRFSGVHEWMFEESSDIRDR